MVEAEEEEVREPGGGRGIRVCRRKMRGRGGRAVAQGVTTIIAHHLVEEDDKI